MLFYGVGFDVCYDCQMDIGTLALKTTLYNNKLIPIFREKVQLIFMSLQSKMQLGKNKIKSEIYHLSKQPRFNWIDLSWIINEEAVGGGFLLWKTNN